MSSEQATLSEAAPVPAIPAQKIRHEWYQTDTEVVLSLFIRNVDASTLSVQFAPRSLSINVPTTTSTSTSFDLDPLSHAIVPEQSSFRVIPAKIEVKFKKETQGIKWAALEGNEDATTVIAPTSSALPSHVYPTSSKRAPTNWDRLAKEALDEETEAGKVANKDPNAGGDKQLNELFQKLYSDATDDQRRAMIKSYQESNGTALSTDWSSVSQGKVETKPPDSMIAKKWGA
ncbi:hypothetical protein MNV49_004492 [Pseudohyphozyma bogoriensis]|nr:hypothetical protein MNV49_004492 [Pseudohyphozyma bogoriensis]